ncbi:MAG: DCC1-like thiol-disulfide oxidoreductase family protein [Deltaproteobacteria bacterium]|nr:DCC1-like thiol-disulfide oxidoreductase family protein [Deltaproteobacteria bacterium]
MKPLLIYDGDCGFCQKFVERWRHVTKDRIDYAPYQEAAPRFPHIPESTFKESVVFIRADGSHATGAEAVFEAKAFGRKMAPGLWAYRKLPGFKTLSEALYRWVARHRK